MGTWLRRFKVRNNHWPGLILNELFQGHDGLLTLGPRSRSTVPIDRSVQHSKLMKVHHASRLWINFWVKVTNIKNRIGLQYIDWAAWVGYLSNSWASVFTWMGTGEHFFVRRNPWPWCNPWDVTGRFYIRDRHANDPLKVDWGQRSLWILNRWVKFLWMFCSNN